MTLTLPDINGKTPQQQLEQMKTYLYQLVSYLQVTQGTANNAETQALQRYVPAGIAQGSGVDPQSWAAVKALIIKSADIVEAFYQEMSTRFEGKYVASSDFGTYTEETDLILQATSKEITQLYENVQTLTMDTESLIQTTAYIRSGLLDHEADGRPIYGIEVGQTDENEAGEKLFNAYARFTADRLSFYDSYGKELAWISGERLYITNVEITGSLVGGGYTVDISDGWAWKWTGG